MVKFIKRYWDLILFVPMGISMMFAVEFINAVIFLIFIFALHHFIDPGEEIVQEPCEPDPNHHCSWCGQIGYNIHG